MSLPFSNTTDRTGLVQLLEDLTNTQSATASSYPLKTKTRDINSAFAKFMMLAVQAGGTWEVDDTNQPDYPIIYGDIVAAQQSYSFIDDETGNQILDIYRVEMKNADGNWSVLKPFSQQDEVESMTQREVNQTGVPTRYEKLANGIFLDVIPNFNSTDGLKIWIARTPTYFLSTDTIKVPGIPDMFHEYLALRPAYFYSLAKGLPRAANYKAEMEEFEHNIAEYYGSRQRDEVPVMENDIILYR